MATTRAVTSFFQRESVKSSEIHNETVQEAEDLDCKNGKSL